MYLMRILFRAANQYFNQYRFSPGQPVSQYNGFHMCTFTQLSGHHLSQEHKAAMAAKEIKPGIKHPQLYKIRLFLTLFLSFIKIFYILALNNI